MIDAILHPFEIVTSWPIATQCMHAVVVSGIGFAFSALVRESTNNRCLRNWARATGAASYFMVAMFAIHVTREVEKLSSELMVREGHHVKEAHPVATQIANPVRVVAVASEYQTTINGQTVSLVRFSDGRPGPVSITARRESSIGNRAGSSFGGIASSRGAGRATHDGTDDVRNGKHVEF